MAESGQQSAFISIYHKRVPVTAEMKIELHRMNSTLRAKMRKERRCAQKDYLQCCGDCLSCYWRRKGIYVSLDSLLDNNESQDDDEADKTMRRIDVLVSPDDVEKTVLMHEMWSAVYKYTDSIVNHGALLFQLSENGLSNRKIAQLMGVNCRRIDRCLHQIRNGLREQLVEFF